MRFLIRSPQNCASAFNVFGALFLAHLVCTLIAAFWLHSFAFFSLLILILFIGVFGLLAYQIGYHPLLAVLWCCALLIPYASLVAIVVLYLQAKKFLKDQNYRIVLFGGRPLPPREVTAEMDALIKAGKIRIPDESRGL